MKNKNPTKLITLLAPKHWPFWLIVGLLRLLILLPFKTQIRLGRYVGKLMYRFSKKSRLTTQVNLRLCFPELTDEERHNLVHQSFESAGIAVFEIAMSWWASNRRLKSLRHLTGFEYLLDAISKKNGVILIGTHQSCLHICGRLLSLDTNFAVVYRRQKIPVFDYIAVRSYHKHFYKAIVREDLRTMIKTLKNSIPMWYTPDIDPKNKASIFVPFFGIPAATITTIAKFSQFTGTKVMPTHYARRDDGKGYDIAGYPPLDNFPSHDIEEDTKRINKVLEWVIRKKPEQYLWQYKRFKTRPNGEKNPYSLAKRGLCYTELMKEIHE